MFTSFMKNNSLAICLCSFLLNNINNNNNNKKPKTKNTQNKQT